MADKLTPTIKPSDCQVGRESKEVALDIVKKERSESFAHTMTHDKGRKKMKKIPLSLLAILLLTFSTYAHAWHLEYTYGGDMWFDGGPDYLHLDDNYWAMADAGWQVLHTDDDPGGGVIVEYDVWSGWDGYCSEGHVSFQIVSDYGNTEPQPVEVHVWGEAEAWNSVNVWGHDYGLDAVGDTEIDLSSDFGPGLHVWAGPWMGGGWDSIDELIEVNTYTEYHVDASIWMDLWADVMGTPPEWFEFWDEYNAFFGGVEYGVIDVQNEAWLDFDLQIESVEVPIPAAVWLLGSGLIGLVGLLRRRQG